MPTDLECTDLDARSPGTKPGRPRFEGMVLEGCPVIDIEGLEPYWVEVDRDVEGETVSVHVLRASEDGLTAAPVMLRITEECARAMAVFVAAKFGLRAVRDPVWNGEVTDPE